MPLHSHSALMACNSSISSSSMSVKSHHHNNNFFDFINRRRRQCDTSNSGKLLRMVRSHSFGHGLHAPKIGHIPYFMQLAALGDMDEMKHLLLKDCNALDGNALCTILSIVGPRPHFRQLSLLNCTHVDDFSALAFCSHLKQLEVDRAHALDDRALQALAEHGKLRVLRLTQCPNVTDAGIRTVLEKCHLKELTLIKCTGINNVQRDNAQTAQAFELENKIDSTTCCDFNSQY